MRVWLEKEVCFESNSRAPNNGRSRQLRAVALALENVRRAVTLSLELDKLAVPDVFSKSKRSKMMAAVRAHGNMATELKLVAIFRMHGITGWRRRQKILGNPDFVFRRKRLAVFVDGCFWHGCRYHFRMPESNQKYWSQKIARNVARDSVITRALKKLGWRVVRIWERSLRKPEAIAERIKSVLRT